MTLRDEDYEKQSMGRGRLLPRKQAMEHEKFEESNTDPKTCPKGPTGIHRFTFYAADNERRCEFCGSLGRVAPGTGVEPTQPVSEPSKHPDCPQGIHDYNVGKHGWCASCSQLYDKRPVVSVPAPPKPDYSYRNIKGSKGIRLNTFNNEPLELERARFHRAIDDEYDGE